MKRLIGTAVTIILCYVLQTTVFHKFELAGIVPNLLLIVTVAVGYMRGQKEAIYTGLACGLLVDCISGSVIGLYALLYMLVGYLNGVCNMICYSDSFIIPIALVGVSDLIYNFLFYVLEFLLRNRLDFVYYLKTNIIREMMYTVLVSIVLYKLLHILNGLLERSETKEE